MLSLNVQSVRKKNKEDGVGSDAEEKHVKIEKGLFKNRHDDKHNLMAIRWSFF